MLTELTAALELHGLGPRVGLLPGGTFPRHRGGVGVLVGLLPGERAAGRAKAAWLLKSMGCSWVKPHEIGVEGHLRGDLLPAPELPPRLVSGTDSASAAELATVIAAKRCADCLAVFPVETFSWRDREKGYRVPYCPPCASTRAGAAYMKRKARAAQRDLTL